MDWPESQIQLMVEFLFKPFYETWLDDHDGRLGLPPYTKKRGVFRLSFAAIAASGGHWVPGSRLSAEA